MARFDKFTTPLQTALADAQSNAIGLDNQFVEPLHLLSALLSQDNSAVTPLLAQSGVNLPRLRNQLDVALDRLPKVQGTPGELHISNDLNRLLNVADKLAQQHGDAYISSEFFVLAVMQDEGETGQLLRQAGGNKQALQQAIEHMRGGEKVDNPDAEGQRQALEKYTIDLTARAE